MIIFGLNEFDRLPMRLLIILFLFSYSAINANAQDTILMLNGKYIYGAVSDTSMGLVTYTYEHRGKVEKAQLERYRVFSVTSEKVESILYRKDTIIGNEFTIPEMRMYIHGEVDCDQRYTAKGWLYGSLIGTYAISLFDTFGPDGTTDANGNANYALFKGAPSMMHIVSPFATVLLAGTFKPRIKPRHVSESMFLSNEEYIVGFRKNARAKRLMRGLVGGLVGSSLGLATWAIGR